MDGSVDRSWFVFSARFHLCRNFGKDIVQNFRWYPGGKLIHESLAVSQFRLKNFSAHRLPGDFKKLFGSNDPGFFVQLPPKNFQRIV